MHAELFALQCFMEWVLKKIQNSGKLQTTLHTHSDCVLFSTAECLICVCSLFMGMHWSLTSGHITEIDANWNFCHLPHVTISTAGKKKKIK